MVRIILVFLLLLACGSGYSDQWCDTPNSVTSSTLYFNTTTANHLGLNSTSANILTFRLDGSYKFQKSVNIINWRNNTMYLRLDDIYSTSPSILVHGPSHIIGPSTSTLRLDDVDIARGFSGFSAYIDGGTTVPQFSVYGR